MIAKYLAQVAILLESPSDSIEEAQQVFSAVDSAITRLHFLARAIRRASQWKFDPESLGFRTDEDRLFHWFAIDRVQRLFPAAKKSLCEHMSDFMATRRAALIRMQQHAQVLAEKREVNPLPRIGTQAGIQASQRRTISSSQISHESSTSSSQNRATISEVHGRASILTPAPQMSDLRSSAFRQNYYKQTLVSISSSNYSLQGSKTASEYPLPPQFKGETGCVPCIFCLEPVQMNRANLKSKKNIWTCVPSPPISTTICN